MGCELSATSSIFWVLVHIILSFSGQTVWFCPTNTGCPTNCAVLNWEELDTCLCKFLDYCSYFSVELIQLAFEVGLPKNIPNLSNMIYIPDPLSDVIETSVDIAHIPPKIQTLNKSIPKKITKLSLFFPFRTWNGIRNLPHRPRKPSFR